MFFCQSYTLIPYRVLLVMFQSLIQFNIIRSEIFYSYLAMSYLYSETQVKRYISSSKISPIITSTEVDRVI